MVACSRSRAWPKAASTTSSAAASAATASTRDWTIPHFEKMLYDNGPLLALLADAWLVTARAAVRARRRGDRRLGDARDAVAARAATTPRSTPTPSTRRASSTSGPRRGAGAAHRRRSIAVAAPHYGLDRPPNFEGRHWHLRVTRAGRARDDDAAARLGAGEALRRAREARAPGPRRKDPGVLERAHDPRHGARRPGVRRARSGSPRRGARSISSARTMWRDGPAARDLQGRPRAPERLPRRPRFPARRAARAHAGANSARRPRVRPGARGRAARAVRGPRSRRILLHGARPRAADPPPEAGARQRDAFGQRRGGLGAAAARRPHRRAALRSRPPSARWSSSIR